MPYPGASPEEVEQGIVLVIEEEIRGIDGIDKITAIAAEGLGTVTAELEDGIDRQRVYQDIKQQVERITTFPLEAEIRLLLCPCVVVLCCRSNCMVTCSRCSYVRRQNKFVNPYWATLRLPKLKCGGA